MAELVAAGFSALLDGMHGGLEPALLKESVYSRGINLSSRGGLVHTRPGFTAIDFQGTVPPGLFQGCGVWSLNSGDRLAFVVDGKVYCWKTGAAVAQLMMPSALLSTTAQCHFCQADRYMVIQDGTSLPVVLEEIGADAHVYPLPVLAADPDVEPDNWVVPLWPGTAMVYVHGRIHLVPRYLPHTTDNGRPYFISGDICVPDKPYECLSFKENEYLSEGIAHSPPMEMGYIYGLSVMRNAATGTGCGPLIVFAQRGLVGFDVSVPRDQWATQAIGQVLFFGPGCVSPWSIIQVNNDLLYRAADGLRSLKYSASAIAGGEGSLANVPQSDEVSIYLKDDAAYLPYVSAAFCDNRLLVTAGGTNSRFFKGFVSLDTAAVASFSGSGTNPSYDGLWQIEGQTIAQVVTARLNEIPTVFAWTAGPGLYRLDPAAVYDGTDTRIRARLVTRVLDFEAKIDRKKLMYLDLWISDLSHDVDISVYFRPSGYPLWAKFGDRHVTVPAGSLSQYRRRLRLSINDQAQAYDPVSQEWLGIGQGFQFALEWQGHMKLDLCRVVASPEAEAAVNVCDETTGAAIAEGAAGVELEEFL